jgi:hypothetical protein
MPDWLSRHIKRVDVMGVGVELREQPSQAGVVSPHPALQAQEGKIASGKLTLVRHGKATGFMFDVKVFVDDHPMVEIENGGRVTLDLPVGQRRVDVSAGGMTRSAIIDIRQGETVRYQVYFSEWGILGGGLNFKSA